MHVPIKHEATATSQLPKDKHAVPVAAQCSIIPTYLYNARGGRICNDSSQKT